MSLLEFRNILRFIRGDDPSPEEKRELFKEAALMALARATSADTNIERVELETVRMILAKVTGEDFSIADVRVAANSEVFEEMPLARYLAGVARKLDAEDRMIIVNSLADVIRSDERISHFETDYFDMVTNALNLTPSEIVGLIAAPPEPIDRG
jgi:uncharacterized tellurite resistance protein B-like protein